MKKKFHNPNYATFSSHQDMKTDKGKIRINMFDIEAIKFICLSAALRKRSVA